MTEHEHLDGEKCASCMADAPGAMASFPTSWEELDTAEAAHEKAEAYEELLSNFKKITTGIFLSDAEPDAKASKLQAAAGELAERVRALPTTFEALSVPASAGRQKGLVGSLKALLGAKASKVEGGITYQASDYADVADAGAPSTWKLRLAEGRSGNFTIAQIARAVTALQPSGFRGQRVEIGSSKGSVVAKISAAIGKAEGDEGQKAALRRRLAAVKGDEGGSFRVYKDASGALRWLAVYSNNLYDKDGEVIPLSEHKAYITRADAEGDYPELWLWHTPGTRLGRADLLDVSEEGFAIASGVFDDGKEAAAEALGSMEGLGVSHGFEYASKTEAGEILGYRTFEVSPLPLGRAANEYTAYLVSKESVMPLTPEKASFLSEVLGKEFVEDLEARLATAKAEADEKGVAWKEVLEAVVSEAEPTPPPEAEPTEPAPAAPGLSLDDVRGAMRDVLADYEGRLATLADEVKALREAKEAAPDKKSIADAVAEAMTSNRRMFLASRSDENVVHGNTAEAKALKGGSDVPEAMRAQVELLALAMRRSPVAEVVGVGANTKDQGEA